MTNARVNNTIPIETWIAPTLQQPTGSGSLCVHRYSSVYFELKGMQLRTIRYAAWSCDCHVKLHHRLYRLRNRDWKRIMCANSLLYIVSRAIRVAVGANLSGGEWKNIEAL